MTVGSARNPNYMMDECTGDVPTLPIPRLLAHHLPGALISVSGMDGTGKTTTLRLMRGYLRSRGVDCVVVSPLSSECRKLSRFRQYVRCPRVAVQGKADLPSLSLICLGDRLFTVRTRLLQLLRRGTWVLCDRYVYTTLAELLVARCSRADFSMVVHVVEQFPGPDLAIVTHVPASEAMRRIRRRPEERHNVLDSVYYSQLEQAFRRISDEMQLVSVCTENSRNAVLGELKPYLDALMAERHLLQDGLRVCEDQR